MWSISLFLPRATSCAVEDFCVAIDLPRCRPPRRGCRPARDAIGLRHGQAFGDDVFHHAGDAFARGDAAVGQLRDGREAVVDAVDDQLGPQRAGDVVGGRHRHAGQGEFGDHLGAAVEGADHQLAAAVVAQVAGAGHLGGDIDHGRVHRPAQRRLQAFGIVVAVLQAEHDGIGGEVGRHFGRGLRRVSVDFHAAQDQVGAGDAVGLRCSPRRLHVLVEAQGFHVQAVALDLVDMGRAADQHHLAPGARQHAAVETADGAGAEHGGLHFCCRLAAAKRAVTMSMLFTWATSHSPTSASSQPACGCGPAHGRPLVPGSRDR
jgi:hypothetical protein